MNANLGDVFDIPFPSGLAKVFGSLKLFQLDVASLVPMDCLVGGGLNFHRRLVFNTTWPIAAGSAAAAGAAPPRPPSGGGGRADPAVTLSVLVW